LLSDVVTVGQNEQSLPAVGCSDIRSSQDAGTLIFKARMLQVCAHTGDGGTAGAGEQSGDVFEENRSS
jgi:hypothetical protein